MTEKQAADIFKALGDEHRIHILKSLHSGEKCACMLLEELNISQPTLSHHMKILCDSGIVNSRKAGKWMYYSICCDGAGTVRQLLQALTSPSYISANCVCREDQS